jgi:hypothetical protein
MEFCPNIVPGCVVRVINPDGHWVVIGQCAYTPNAIAAVIQGAGLKWAFVKWACGVGAWDRDGKQCY